MMTLIEVIKCEGNISEFVWKFPSVDLKLGAQLIVNYSQIAFFVKNGIICDEFQEGRYTLKSANIPLLNKIINLPFGDNSPFAAEVWYVNMLTKLDNKWGTIKPINLEDPLYGIVVPARAFGQFGFKILNEPRAYYENNSIAYNRLKSVQKAPYGGQYTLSTAQKQTFVSYDLEDGEF